MWLTGVMTPIAIEETAAPKTVRSVTRPSFMPICVSVEWPGIWNRANLC